MGKTTLSNKQQKGGNNGNVRKISAEDDFHHSDTYEKDDDVVLRGRTPRAAAENDSDDSDTYEESDVVAAPRRRGRPRKEVAIDITKPVRKPVDPRNKALTVRGQETQRRNKLRREERREKARIILENCREKISETKKRWGSPTPVQFTMKLRGEGTENREKRKVTPLEKLPVTYPRNDKRKKQKQPRPTKPRTGPVSNKGLFSMESLRVMRGMAGSGFHQYPSRNGTQTVWNVNTERDPENRGIPTGKIVRMEKKFAEVQYLHMNDKMRLARQLNLTPKQVSDWFSNRRKKEKRLAKLGLKKLPEQMKEIEKMNKVRKGLGHHLAVPDGDKDMEEEEEVDEPEFDEDEDEEADEDMDSEVQEEVEEARVVNEIKKKPQIYWGDDDSDDDDFRPSSHASSSRRAETPEEEEEDFE